MLHNFSVQKMKMKFRIIGNIAIAAVTTVILGSCSSDPDSPGLEYMPDMYRSPAIEPNVDYGHIRERENMDAKMQLSALTPPSGTIPYFGTDSTEVMLMLPFKYKASAEFRVTHGMYGEDLTSVNTYEKAAEFTHNPLPLPDIADSNKYKAFWSDAKTLFNTNCAHCHGEKGDGNGPMMTNGVYIGVPDYKNLTISQGQMFYSIYYGRNAMGAHRSIINKKEIWTLVHYIKRFQDEDYGTGKVVAAPADVEADADETPEAGK